MPRRRPFGKVFRRRRTVKDGAGGTRVGFRPGDYVRFRAGGREVTRFAGNDRDTAVAYAQRLTREADRRDLLGETPRSDLRFEDFCDTYLSIAKQSMTQASCQSRRRLVTGVLLPAFKGRLLDEITPPDIPAANGDILLISVEYSTPPPVRGVRRPPHHRVPSQGGYWRLDSGHQEPKAVGQGAECLACP